MVAGVDGVVVAATVVVVGVAGASGIVVAVTVKNIVISFAE